MVISSLPLLNSTLWGIKSAKEAVGWFVEGVQKKRIMSSRMWMQLGSKSFLMGDFYFSLFLNGTKQCLYNFTVKSKILLHEIETVAFNEIT